MVGIIRCFVLFYVQKWSTMRWCTPKGRKGRAWRLPCHIALLRAVCVLSIGPSFLVSALSFACSLCVLDAVCVAFAQRMKHTSCSATHGQRLTVAPFLCPSYRHLCFQAELALAYLGAPGLSYGIFNGASRFCHCQCEAFGSFLLPRCTFNC